MKNRFTKWIAIFSVCVFMLPAMAYGTNPQDQLNEVNNKINNVNNQISAGKKLEKTLKAQINALQSKINAAQAEVNNLSSDIVVTQKRIDEATTSLNELEAEMETQNNNLNSRLRTMYKNGSVGFLDVMLGSTSITDLLTNMDRVQMIYDSDKEVMENLKIKHDVVVTKKAELQQMQAALIQKKLAVASKKNELDGDKSQVAAKKNEVAANNEALEELKDSYLAEANRIKADILAAQSKGTTYIGGSMAWPVPGVTKITSKFGYRIHPISGKRKLHTGLDIGAPTGSNVVAGNDGTVIKSGWNNSYGNVVMVDHGGGIVTLYAHNSRLLVSAGDTVTRGQTIAKSGSTGDSTGPHLHFEVRVNGDYKDPQAGWI